MYVSQRKKLEQQKLDLEQKINSLQILCKEFEHNDTKTLIQQRLLDHKKKFEYIDERITIFDRLYEEYILKIIQILNKEKQSVMKNLHMLRDHPDILQELVKDIKQKENAFKDTMKLLQI